MITISGLLLGYDTLAQMGPAIPPETRSQIAIEQINRGGLRYVSAVIYGLEAPLGRVVGNEFLDEKWNMGNVLLESGVWIERYNVRYDLRTQKLEIQTTAGIKLLDWKMLSAVNWKNEVGTRHFVNAGAFKLDGKPMIGVLEVLSDGRKRLVRSTTMYVKKPDYNVALDVGSRDIKIIKKTALYCVDGDKLIVVDGRKDMLIVLNDKRSEIETYITANNLETKTEFEITRIFDYYNLLYARQP